MESSNKFLIMIGGLALTLAVLTFAFFTYNTIKGTGNSAITKATDATNSMLETNITQYNRTGIPGSEVLNAITTFMESSEEIYVEVKTTGSTTVYIYPNKTVTSDNRMSNNAILEALQKAKQKGNSEYISPKGKFDGKIVYADSDNSVIVGLYFEQKQ